MTLLVDKWGKSETKWRRKEELEFGSHRENPSALQWTLRGTLLSPVSCNVLKPALPVFHRASTVACAVSHFVRTPTENGWASTFPLDQGDLATMLILWNCIIRSSAVWWLMIFRERVIKQISSKSTWTWPKLARMVRLCDYHGWKYSNHTFVLRNKYQIPKLPQICNAYLQMLCSLHP